MLLLELVMLKLRFQVGTTSSPRCSVTDCGIRLAHLVVLNVPCCAAMANRIGMMMGFKVQDHPPKLKEPRRT